MSVMPTFCVDWVSCKIRETMTFLACNFSNVHNIPKLQFLYMAKLVSIIF